MRWMVAVALAVVLAILAHQYFGADRQRLLEAAAPGRPPAGAAQTR